MNARKIGAGILVFLTALGTLLCLVILIGAWAARPAINETGTSLAATISEYLTLADGGLTQITGILDDTQTRLTDDSEQVDQLDAAAEELATGVRRLVSFARQLHEGLNTMNDTIVLLNRTIPNSNIPTMTNELAQLDRQLETLADQIQAFRTRLAAAGVSKPSDDAIISSLLGDISTNIGTMKSQIDTTQVTVQRTITQLGVVQANLALWTALLATGVSLVMLLLGAGQVSLLLRAWAWLQTA
ncbi:MAG: hypothetical protein HC911_08100 [Chloroflexaceae bacterium]|nr:hypothetical protein [Chloroflexaceae bacterium]